MTLSFVPRSLFAVALLCAPAHIALAGGDKGALREAACAAKPAASERAICLDRDLTRRDAELNEVYGRLRDKSSKTQFEPVREEQRQWLKERDRCGSDVTCLSEKYTDRLYVLENALEGLSFPDKSHVEIGSQPGCEAFGKLKSAKSNEAVTVVFTNASKEYRAVMWLDFNGRPVDYATLNHGESYTVKTYAGHAWMFTDGPGNCIELFVAEAGAGKFAISKKSPGFGAGED